MRSDPLSLRNFHALLEPLYVLVNYQVNIVNKNLITSEQIVAPTRGYLLNRPLTVCSLEIFLTLSIGTELPLCLSFSK
jgi:hypothetical protein